MPPLMPAFAYQSGQLCCEGVPVPPLAARFGTPTYIYSRAAIRESFERLKRRLADVHPLVCYSVKANSHLRILSLMREVGAAFDIVSGGELARVLRAGARGESVVYSGVGKTRTEIDAALAAGILMFNVESEGELELLEARARALGKKAGMAIRINPHVRASTHPYVATGQTIHKFGVTKRDALALYRRAAASPDLRVRGVACHIGSQILEVEPFLKALDELIFVGEALRSQDIPVEFLDLGGGFGIRYKEEIPLDVGKLTRGLASRLKALPYRMILEPGRALVAEAGLLLTRVLYVKRNRRKNFVVVDAGMNDLLRPALYGSYHQIVPAERHGRIKLRADVVGPLCETGDFLARDREISCPRPGELLAVLTAGAYGYVQSSNYNSRPRPAEILVSGARATLIRPRESIEALMAGEVG
jgi:diaminopimelate decarboxylase